MASTSVTLLVSVVAITVIFFLLFVTVGPLDRQNGKSLRPASPNDVFLPTQPLEFMTSRSKPTHVANPKQKSKYAYTTLISGFNSEYKYRGFLYNALIMLKALREQGSTADFIALIGVDDEDQIEPYQSDLDLLRSHGIITSILPRMLDRKHPMGFAEMALLKITPWSFVHYSKVQFLDGDVMPTRNMDCFFELAQDTFTVGAASPLNSGWYLALPNQKAHDYMRSKVSQWFAVDEPLHHSAVWMYVLRRLIDCIVIGMRRADGMGAACATCS